MKGTCKITLNLNSLGAELLAPLGEMSTACSGLVSPGAVHVIVGATRIRPFSQGIMRPHDSSAVSFCEKKINK